MQNLSPEGRCKAYPVGIKLFLLMFYSPKGDTQYLTRAPIVFTYVLFALVDEYQVSKVNRVYQKNFLGNVLSPEGRCVAYSLGVQLRPFPLLNFGIGKVYWILKIYRVYYVFLFLKMFYPPKGDTQYLTRGPIDTLSIYWGQ